ncbi:MAG TPA: hypothetical protein VNM22_02930 [Candidatus Limnocylindrales bacterium]|nr:hypothetical protein [Candidatus Limnocylindrales bacterium]
MAEEGIEREGIYHYQKWRDETIASLLLLIKQITSLLPLPARKRYKQEG